MRFHTITSPAPPQQVRQAWQRFVASGAIDTAWVRPPVADAWQRSRAAGCDPWQARADLLSPLDTIALIRAENRLVEIASPFLAALSRAAGDERHAAMLADGRGRVLKIVGDAATVSDENFPRAGSLLSEDVAGANGIGTALAEGGYVELAGPEHFIEGFHAFTCQGVPLLGTGARPAGVLSMSVRREQVARKVRDILFCASEAAECELLSQHLADTLASAGPLDRVVETLRQDVVQRITMARLQFEIAARLIARGAPAAETLQAAQELARKFRRQAAVWRNLVEQGTGAAEPILLADLAEGFMELLGTEARLAGARLCWGASARVLVLDDMHGLSRRLLGAFLQSLQAAGRDGEVTVDVDAKDAEGRVTLTARGSGPPVAQTVVAPLLR